MGEALEAEGDEKWFFCLMCFIFCFGGVYCLFWAFFHYWTGFFVSWVLKMYLLVAASVPDNLINISARKIKSLILKAKFPLSLLFKFRIHWWENWVINLSVCVLNLCTCSWLAPSTVASLIFWFVLLFRRGKEIGQLLIP